MTPSATPTTTTRPHVTTSLASIPVSNSHAAVCALMLRVLSDFDGWRRVEEESDSTNASRPVHTHFKLCSPCGGCLLVLRCVSLFDSIHITASLSLPYPKHQAQSATPIALSSSSSCSSSSSSSSLLFSSARIALPSLLIPRVSALLPPHLFAAVPPHTAVTLSSLPGPAIDAAVACLYSLLHDPPVRWHARVVSAWQLAARNQGEEIRFSRFIDHYISTHQHQATHPSQVSPIPSSSSSVDSWWEVLERVGGSNRHASPAMQRSALVVFLVHLLLEYQGFAYQPLDNDQSTCAEGTCSSTSTIEFPWSLLRCPVPAVCSLSYRHPALSHLLPHHFVHVKIVSLFDQHVFVHVQLKEQKESSVNACAQFEPSAGSSGVGGEGEAAGQGQAANASAIQDAGITPQVYTIQLRSSTFVCLPLDSSSTGATSVPSPSGVYQCLPLLVNQFRNAVLLPMLGDTAPLDTSTPSTSDKDASLRWNTDQEAKSPSKSDVSLFRMLPQDIAISILQFLPSTDVVTVGGACWSLSYLAAHPLVWKALCERELSDALAVAAADESTHSATDRKDWRGHFLAVRYMRHQSKQESARSTGSMSSWSFAPMGAFPVGGYPAHFGHPPLHPRPFYTPGAPFFTLPPFMH